MGRVILASNNKHKIEEFRKMFINDEVLTMAEIGFVEEIDETGSTFLENSKIKAEAVAKYCREKNIVATVVADDSGLCVDALNGAPGIYTARYGGNHDPIAGRKKLLKEMEGVKDRDAHYECVIVLISPNGKCLHVEGKAYGKIADKEYGDSGFAFDPVFFSNDLKKTFGQATMEEKNAVSHRAKAFEALRKLEGAKKAERV